jgi:3-hydroxyisobutyrate dehydrogenase-like beta-hydroxyacid dehydrogenase
MGGPMAARVVAGGFDVVVYDISSAAMDRAAKAGARIAPSPAAAASGANMVMTMLPNSDHIHAAVLGKHGVIETLSPGSLFVEMSTIAVSASTAIATEIKARGARFIDAPVGRSPEDARKGTLLVMAGGAADDIARAMPVFRCFADTIVHVGPEGHGIRLKLVNNYMSMINVAVAAETLTLAAKVGLNRDTVVKVLSGTAAGRGQLVVNYPRKVLAGDITPDFPLRMGHKDLGLALQLGDQVKSPLLIGAVVRELFGLATPMGRADQDCTAMLLMLEDLAGVPSATCEGPV